LFVTGEGSPVAGTGEPVTGDRSKVVVGIATRLFHIANVTFCTMNPYQQDNPLLQWLFEHIGTCFFLTIVWYFWVAIALGYICFQLYKLNEREELRGMMRNFYEEQREREKKTNP